MINEAKIREGAYELWELKGWQDGMEGKQKTADNSWLDSFSTCLTSRLTLGAIQPIAWL